MSIRLFLKIIKYDMWYMHIEICTIILENMITIWMLLGESKLKPYELKLLKLKILNNCQEKNTITL